MDFSPSLKSLVRNCRAYFAQVILSVWNYFKIDNNFWIFFMEKSLTVRVNHLGVSARDRIISRVCFYLLVPGVVWTTNYLLPDWEAIEREKWEARGVVPPLIAVPLSELSSRLPASRKGGSFQDP
jgi:hypothetical protein